MTSALVEQQTLEVIETNPANPAAEVGGLYTEVIETYVTNPAAEVGTLYLDVIVANIVAPSAPVFDEQASAPAGNGSATFAWGAVDLAAHYELQIDTGSGYGDAIVVEGTTYTANDLTPGGSVTARVRGVRIEETVEYPGDYSTPITILAGEGPALEGRTFKEMFFNLTPEQQARGTTGSWARRVAEAIEAPATGGTESWSERIYYALGLNEEEQAKVGGWKTRVRRGLSLGLGSGGSGGGGTPDTYLGILNDLGATRYWDLADAEGNFTPTIGTDEFTVGSSLARATNAGPFGDDATMAITGGIHTTPKAELGTTTWTLALWVLGGGGTGYRAMVGGGESDLYRVFYLNGQQLFPYQFSWNSQQGPALSESRWYLVVLGSGTDGITYWLDGVEEHFFATPVELTTNSSSARWGTNGVGGEGFTNPMAHPATWDRKLTGAEVTELWTSASALLA